MNNRLCEDVLGLVLFCTISIILGLISIVMLLAEKLPFSIRSPRKKSKRESDNIFNNMSGFCLIKLTFSNLVLLKHGKCHQNFDM